MIESGLSFSILGDRILDRLRETDIGRITTRPQFRDDWWQLTSVISRRFISINEIEMYFNELIELYPDCKIYLYSISMMLWPHSFVNQDHAYILRYAIKVRNIK